MSKYTDEFFGGKRSWSRIKDKILDSYMPAYIAKVRSRGQRLLLIDAFAGSGRCSAAGILGTPIVEYHNERETRKHGKTTHFYTRVQV
jgi:hypothetical protein